VASARCIGLPTSAPTLRDTLAPKAGAKSSHPKPTDEMEHILDLVKTTKKNILVRSDAGTGKSTILKLIDHADRTEPKLYLAFGKRNVEEAVEDRKASYDDGRLAFRDTTDIRTSHSLGYRVWRDTLGIKKLDVSFTKNSDILREAIYARPKRLHSEAFDEFFEITSAISLAKNLGYVPDNKYHNAKRLADGLALEQRLDTKLSELGWELVDEVLLASIQASYKGRVDFDDQIYMPAVFGGTYPQFGLILVDERQDLNPCNHAMLCKFRESRIIAVGDSGQSIYAFRGAYPDGMERHAADFDAVEACLTVSFRCPEAIVKAVQWHKPKMRWNRAGGLATALLDPQPDNFVDGCAIICRNNAPLFAMALRLLASGRSVTVQGTDVGPKVVAIMRKLGNENMSQRETLSAIDWWLQEKLAKQSSTASDIADCMRVFARNGQTLSTSIAWAESLFAQEGNIQLLTGHKAKGLEWNLVFHLDPHLINLNLEQERNLKYVITTRSKDTLYEINSQEIQWSPQHQG